MKFPLIVQRVSRLWRKDEAMATSNQKVVHFEDCVRINNERFSSVTQIAEINVQNQYYAALTANILALSVGASIGWVSPSLSILQSQETPLNIPINTQQASWIGSLLPLGALFGTIFFGWLSDITGRFWALWLTALPQIISWLCIIAASSVGYIYVGRFAAGICTGGIFTLIPLYVSEISNASLRGILGSFFLLTVNLGTLLMFIIGSYLSYSIVSSLMLSFPLIFMLLFLFFPETPYYLLKCSKTKKAENSLKFLHGCRKAEETPDILKVELLLIAKKVEHDASIHEMVSIAKEFKLKSSRKALIIGIVLVTVNQLCGCFAFINYTAEIFQQSGSSLSPNMSAIIIAAIQLAGSVISIFIVEKITRKLLYSLSCCGTIIGLLSFGLHGMLRTFYDVANFNWVPVVSMSFVIFIASVGIMPLTFTMLAEILPSRIRSIGVTFCTSLLWFIAFLLLRFFPIAVATIQLHNCMYVFCVITFMGMLFVIFIVPETKGRSGDEIEKHLGS